MPQIELRVPKKLESWYKPTRHTLGSTMKLHGLELASENLMDLSRRPLQGKQLESALEAYVELRDGVQEVVDSLDKIQLMLKVVGENLMAGYAEDNSS